MNRNGVAKFEKVSLEQFMIDWKTHFPLTSENKMKAIYDSIVLPKRGTTGSAGYDFYLPDEIGLREFSSIVIPTGVRCKIDDGWVLNIYPRSGHGFKYGVRLANTVGVIDSDYYGASNEGHIHVKLVNDSNLSKEIIFEAHTAFCQGVFIPFGTTVDDDVEAKRIGGFGSTDK